MGIYSFHFPWFCRNLPVPDFVRRDSGKTFYNTDIRTG
jgi:hypothetical protein